MTITKTLYDRIGEGYDTTRKADKGIVEKIRTHLDPYPGDPYLDVACGSGNYTVALADQGCSFHGIDVSEKMLCMARSKPETSV
jgi:ubiquinone/menaquinone biosynthesis C-methylase UbiE